MKTKIILDTTTIFHNPEKDFKEIFGSTLEELTKFIKEHKLTSKVSIIIPQVVIDERVGQRLIQFDRVIENTRRKIDEINKLTPKKTKTLFKVNDKAYKKKILDEVKRILKKLRISSMPLPSKIHLKKIYKRAIQKKAPFSEGGDGLKDSLIWLSLINDAKKRGVSKYIFCTNNTTDFQKNEKDLKLELKKEAPSTELFFVRTIGELKSYLDDIFDLSVDLKEKHKELKNKIQEKIGSIMLELNKKDFTLHDYGIIPSLSDDERPVYLNFQNIHFLDINIEKDKNNITAIIDVIATKPAAYDSLGAVSVPMTTLSSNAFSNSEFAQINLQLEYLPESDNLQIKEIYPNPPLSIKIDKIDFYDQLIKTQYYKPD